MGYFPIFLQLQGARCLVAGGSGAAQARVEALLEAGAAVTIISPKLTSELEGLSTRGEIRYLQRECRPEDVAGFALVFVSGAGAELGRELSAQARRDNVLINVADEPGLCSFIMPARIKRGRLQVAISTGGASPALARQLRERLEGVLGEELNSVLELLLAAREWLKIHEPDPVTRSAKLHALVEAGLDRMLRQSDIAALRRAVARVLGESFPIPVLQNPDVV